MSELTLTQRMTNAQDRFQKIQLHFARMEESLKQKKGEAKKKTEKVETIVGNKGLDKVDGKIKELYEELFGKFQELEGCLDELSNILEIEKSDIDALQI